MKDMNETNGLTDLHHDDVTEKIIGCAIQIHRGLGPGFLEIIYHRAMAHELRKVDLRFEEEAAMQVLYDEVVLGDYFADFLVERHAVVEIKAVASLTTAHEIQLVNYLNAVKFDLGLLINFGGARIDVKRKYRHHNQKKPSLHVPHVTPV
jgi:GxxExxY protein